MSYGQSFPSFSEASSVKPRLFVSYHHDGDQQWYDGFSRLFSQQFDIFTDRSLRNPIHSLDPDYIYRRIREDYIKGSSMTIVLCGNEAHKRKFVDWEIKATLDQEHALLGIIIPGNSERIVPGRLYDNTQSGYAHWIEWTNEPAVLQSAIAQAQENARFKSRIVNNRSMMQRNEP